MKEHVHLYSAKIIECRLMRLWDAGGLWPLLYLLSGEPVMTSAAEHCERSRAAILPLHIKAYFLWSPLTTPLRSIYRSTHMLWPTVALLPSAPACWARYYSKILAGHSSQAVKPLMRHVHPPSKPCSRAVEPCGRTYFSVQLIVQGDENVHLWKLLCAVLIATYCVEDFQEFAKKQSFTNYPIRVCVSLQLQ